MHAKNLALNECTERQVVKYINDILPDIGVPIFPLHLIVKPVELRRLPAFMVPPKKGHSTRVL